MSFLINPYVLEAGGFATPAPEVEFDGRNLPGSDGDLTTWTDSSGNGRDATGPASAQQTVNGVLNGHAVSRWGGGAGSRLDFTQLTATNVFTIIAVVKCTDSGNRTILANLGGASGTPRFAIDTNLIWLAEDDNIVVGASSTTLNTTSFYTVAVTWDGGSNAWVFYLNGASDGSGTTSNTFTVGVGRVGCRNGNQNVFKGDIAYVAFWDSILTSDDLTNGGTGKTDELRSAFAHY